MTSSTARIITTELLKALPLVEHGDDASKANRGKLLIVAGSSRLPGTAILAARAALRVGCGTVRVAAPASVATLIGIVVPELMVVPLPETSSGTPSLASLALLEEQYGSCDAAVVGPGMGEHVETDLLARRLVEEMPLPLVVDAQALLALAPIAAIVDPASVVVDGKSGISGAGRTLKESSHAATVLENVVPYAVGEHKHAPEIAQLLGFSVTFVPHVVPLRRGLVCTCYVSASEDPRPLLEAAYAGSHVVEVVDAVPDLARLQGTDAAEVAAFEDQATGRWIVISALDNLGKGAAGQAVQNANLALGLDETAGLRLSGVLV